MGATNIRQQFDLYRKWFKTLLVKEFMNLPLRYQDKFIIMVKKFLEDCERVYDEAKVIKEKEIQLTIINVCSNVTEDFFRVYAKSPELKHKIFLPLTKKGGSDVPKIGDKLNYMVFSLDEKTWYSSKEELIKKSGPERGIL